MRYSSWAAPSAPVPMLAPGVGFEQCPDVIEALDAHDLLGVELAPNFRFEREHEAQVGQAVPALERSDARVLRDGGELRMDRLRQQSSRRADFAHWPRTL